MTSIYEIRNKDNDSKVPINEHLILRTIKSLEGRQPELRKRWIYVWEELQNKKFDKKIELQNL